MYIYIYGNILLDTEIYKFLMNLPPPPNTYIPDLHAILQRTIIIKTRKNDSKIYFLCQPKIISLIIYFQLSKMSEQYNLQITNVQKKKKMNKFKGYIRVKLNE